MFGLSDEVFTIMIVMAIIVTIISSIISFNIKRAKYNIYNISLIVFAILYVCSFRHIDNLFISLIVSFIIGMFVGHSIWCTYQS